MSEAETNLKKSAEALERVVHIKEVVGERSDQVRCAPCGSTIQAVPDAKYAYLCVGGRCVPRLFGILTYTSKHCERGSVCCLMK